MAVPSTMRTRFLCPNDVCLRMSNSFNVTVAPRASRAVCGGVPPRGAFQGEAGGNAVGGRFSERLVPHISGHMWLGQVMPALTCRLLERSDACS
jgi:hypothetical protein